MINEKDMAGNRVIGIIFGEHSPAGPVYRTSYGGFTVENEFPQGDEANLIVFEGDFSDEPDFFESTEMQIVTKQKTTANDNKRILNESKRLKTGLRWKLGAPLHRRFLKSALKQLTSGFRRKNKKTK